MAAIADEFPRNWVRKGIWSKESQEPEYLEQDWEGGRQGRRR